MKERPILMSGQMVRAILEGRKSQTRRAMKPQPSDEFHPEQNGTGYIYCPTMIDGRGLEYPGKEIFGVADEDEGHKSPCGMPGERLWVKETFRLGHKNLPKVIYRADDEGIWGGKWKPSVFMPRWASRITLEILEVRVERLQDISEEDAKAEGCTTGRFLGNLDNPKYSHVKEYQELWESINGKNSWQSNPWVWCISFRKL